MAHIYGQEGWKTPVKEFTLRTVPDFAIAQAYNLTKMIFFASILPRFWSEAGIS